METQARRFHVLFTNAITGIITGIVYSDRDFAKIISATITASIGGLVVNIPVLDGSYVAAVTPGTFDLTGLSSGYQSASVADVTVRAGAATTVNIIMTSSSLKGDLDGSGTVNLADAILALKIASGVSLPSGVTIHRQNSVNVNRKIGMEDALYIMQKAAGLRQEKY